MINHSQIYVISLPPKIWRLTPSSQYIPVEYADDIDEGIFDYSHHGKAVYQPKLKWEHRDRHDLITYNECTDKAELDKGLVFGTDVPTVVRGKIRSMVIKYWDCFCNTGAKRTIID